MLYSDDEETIFDAMRPVILNGITDVATRNDLIERAICPNLPTIPEQKRRTERSFWKHFEQARPRILGALLTALSGAMRCLPGVRLDRPPRMADFAEWAVAAETALGWPSGTFLSAYRENGSASDIAALEASPLTPHVVKLVEQNGEWRGTPTELLAELSQRAGEMETKKKEWPRTAHGLSGDLRRLAPGFQKIGVDLDFPRTNQKRFITIKKRANEGALLASPASLHRESKANRAWSPRRGDADHDAVSDASLARKLQKKLGRQS